MYELVIIWTYNENAYSNIIVKNTLPLILYLENYKQIKILKINKINVFVKWKRNLFMKYQIMSPYIWQHYTGTIQPTIN